MSTSDLCQALLGQYPWTQKHYLKEFPTITFLCESYQETCVFSYETKVLYKLKAACLNQHQHTRSLDSRSILYCIWCLQVLLSVCAEALTECHLLHQTVRSERGKEGGSGEEAKGPAPGVTLDGSLQRFPEGGRACQAVREGRKYNVPCKGGNWVWGEHFMGEMKTDISLQTLCRYVLDDLYEHPALEKDVRELQKLYQLHRRQWVIT